MSHSVALCRTMACGDRAAQVYAVLLEPGDACDDYFVAVRRLLLMRKAMEGKLQRQRWKANGMTYLAYRDFLRQNKKEEKLKTFVHPPPSPPLSLPLPPPPLSTKPSETPFVKGPPPASPSLISKPSMGKDRKGVLSENERDLSFSGILCTFTDCKVSVNCIKFGRLSSDIFAYGASNGVFRICVVEKEPRLLHDLKGHTKEITDFDWSFNNYFLCSASMDKSVRVWNVSSGECLRIIYGQVAQLCIRFHPVNNNLLLVGNANDEITVLNFSTGRVSFRLPLESRITVMDLDTIGHVLFAGDANGCIHSIKVDPKSGTMQRVHRNYLPNSKKAPSTSLHFHSFSEMANGPVLLACTLDGSLRFFSVALEVDGYLSLKCALQLSPRAHNIKASFCPFLSSDKTELIVTGSDDHNVYFYDFRQPKRPLKGKLQGHGAPVVDVCWNHGENFLASSDCDGLIIVWRRNEDS